MTSRRKVSGRSPARTGMTGVMAMKGLSRKTRETCPGSVRRLARHCGRAPHALSAEEVRSWVMGRMERGLLSPRTTNAGTSAPRPFFADAMGQPGKVEGPRCRRVPDRLPRSIPEADAGRLIRGIDDPRHRMAALTAYGAGLRIPEVVALQVGDVRGGEGLPRIRAGGGPTARSPPTACARPSTRAATERGSAAASLSTACATRSPPICMNAGRRPVWRGIPSGTDAMSRVGNCPWGRFGARECGDFNIWWQGGRRAAPLAG